MSDEPFLTSLLLEDVVDWCAVAAAVGVAQQSHVLLAPLAAAEATVIKELIMIKSLNYLINLTYPVGENESPLLTPTPTPPPTAPTPLRSMSPRRRRSGAESHLKQNNFLFTFRSKFAPGSTHW